MTERCLFANRYWRAALLALIVTDAWAAPAVRSADLGALAMWVGASCAGALIALLAVVLAQRMRNAREMAALRHSMAASAHWWWLTDASGTVQEVQPSRRPVTWFDCKTLVHRKPWQIEPQAPCPSAVAQAMNARTPFFDVLLHVPTEGASRVLSLSGAPLFSATGSLTGYAGTCNDLTELIATLKAPTAASSSDELNALRASFIQRSRAYELAIKDLDSFAHSVSHDLRAPLRVVDGFAHILLEDYAQAGRALDDLGHNHIKRIIAAGARMNTMIDTLLSMARMTSKEVACTRVNLSAIAHEMAEELQAQHSVADHQTPTNPVQFIIADHLIVDGDPSLLSGVMQNLLGNAWKFSARQASPRIEFGMRHHDGQDQYFVRDNGAGFDMRFADKLFGLFQRFHSSSEYPGTGVGLATVQRIIRKHGGRIWAESEPGKGACFYFTLWDNGSKL